MAQWVCELCGYENEFNPSQSEQFCACCHEPLDLKKYRAEREVEKKQEKEIKTQHLLSDWTDVKRKAAEWIRGSIFMNKSKLCQLAIGMMCLAAITVFADMVIHEAANNNSPVIIADTIQDNAEAVLGDKVEDNISSNNKANMHRAANRFIKIKPNQSVVADNVKEKIEPVIDKIVWDPGG